MPIEMIGYDQGNKAAYAFRHANIIDRQLLVIYDGPHMPEHGKPAKVVVETTQDPNPLYSAFGYVSNLRWGLTTSSVKMIDINPVALLANCRVLDHLFQKFVNSKEDYDDDNYASAADAIYYFNGALRADSLFERLPFIEIKKIAHNPEYSLEFSEAVRAHYANLQEAENIARDLAHNEALASKRILDQIALAEHVETIPDWGSW